MYEGIKIAPNNCKVDIMPPEIPASPGLISPLFTGKDIINGIMPPIPAPVVIKANSRGNPGMNLQANIVPDPIIMTSAIVWILVLFHF